MIRLIILAVSGGILIIFFLDIYIQAQKRMSLSEKMRKTSNKIYATADGDPMLYFHPDNVEYRIGCQPDEILETQDDQLVPFDYKSELTRFEEPPLFYLYQFGCYFASIEEEYGRAPEYGILEDLNTSKFFKIENTAELQEKTIQIASEIYSKKTGKETASRDHEEVGLCRTCDMHGECDEAIS